MKNPILSEPDRKFRVVWCHAETPDTTIACFLGLGDATAFARGKSRQVGVYRGHERDRTVVLDERGDVRVVFRGGKETR